MSEPKLVFRHVDDLEFQEVRTQFQGERRAGVHIKFLEFSPNRTLLVTHYDPHLVLDMHRHGSDHMIYITGGSLSIGGVECTPGMMILLEQGAAFGPLIAGPEGTDLLEFYTGDVTPTSADPEGYKVLLEERGITVAPHPEFDPSVANALD
jgi:hypothetical protein